MPDHALVFHPGSNKWIVRIDTATADTEINPEATSAEIRETLCALASHPYNY